MLRKTSVRLPRYADQDVSIQIRCRALARRKEISVPEAWRRVVNQARNSVHPQSWLEALDELEKPPFISTPEQSARSAEVTALQVEFACSTIWPG